MEMDKENIVQAVVIMDTFNSNFSPLTDNKPMVCNLFEICIFI